MLWSWSILSLINQGQWTGYLKVEDKEGIQDYENGSKDNGSHKILLSSSNHVAKGINELDLSECAQCSPSYRLLPDDVSAS